MHTSNQNPDEIAQFNALAGDWWDPNGPLKTLHAINPHRLAYVQRFTSLKQASVADIGCGGGLFSEALAKLGAKVTACDAAPALIETAKQHALDAGLNIDYRCAMAEELATTHASHFDVVVCMELLEHVPEPTSLLQACATLAKPGGFVIVSTLNRTVKSFALAIVAAEYILNWLPRGTHQYAQFIRPSELLTAARKMSLQNIDLSGLSYAPLRKQFKLSEDIAVNYFACFKKEV